MKSVIVVGIVAAGSLLLGCTSSGEESQATSTFADSAAKPVAETTVVTVTTASSTTTSTSTTTAPSPTTSTTVARVVPPGWDTWTLIYASLPVDDHDRADAERTATLVDGGAVLLSDEYPSLNPGFWVVYAGEFGQRFFAGNQCPINLDPSLSCYPRYLGEDIAHLLADGAALAELGDGQLVVIEPDTASVVATFDQSFSGDGAYPSHFNLSADWGTLYFGVGFEDSWYSCDSERGRVKAVDLDSGVETLVGYGRGPSISPDRRWLAIVAADECYSDPENEAWFVAPGNAIEIFDLTDGDYAPEYVLRPSSAPTSYDDPNSVIGVMWDHTFEGGLLVSLADGTVRLTAYDSGDSLDDSELFWASEVGALATVNATQSYVVEWDGEATVVSVLARPDGDEVDRHDINGWVTGFALGRSGDVIITTWEYLILPNGVRVPVEAGINNLAW